MAYPILLRFPGAGGGGLPPPMALLKGPRAYDYSAGGGAQASNHSVTGTEIYPAEQTPSRIRMRLHYKIKWTKGTRALFSF